MNPNPLREALVEWLAVACALTVFVAAALDAPEAAAADSAVPTASSSQGR